MEKAAENAPEKIFLQIWLKHLGFKAVFSAV